MADHGFCTIKKEVYVNRWLMDHGWLKLRNVPPDRKKGLDEIDPSSVAYSLDPGRVVIRVQGREKEGCVAPAPSTRRSATRSPPLPWSCAIPTAANRSFRPCSSARSSTTAPTWSRRPT